MTESEAIVTRLEGGYAWLEILDRPSGCGKCESAGSCGGSGSFQRVPNAVGARVGDHVLVGVADGAILTAAVVSYAVPLATTLGGAIAGGGLGGEVVAVAGAVLGLLIGWLSLRFLDRRMATRREPLLALRIKPAVIRLQRISGS